MARLKKEDPFYTMLRDFSADVVACAQDYDTLVKGYPDTQTMIPQMKLHESTCDERVKNIMMELYKSFITPFDRNDISELALRMDDVVDNMKGVSTRLELFNVSKSRVEAVEMADLTLMAVREMHEMIDHLPHYKDDPACMQRAIAVGKIEDEGDTVYENALRNLFHDENLDDQRRGHVVGWLRIFDRMEQCLDSVESVAHIVRSVIMKSA